MRDLTESAGRLRALARQCHVPNAVVGKDDLFQIGFLQLWNLFRVSADLSETQALWRARGAMLDALYRELRAEAREVPIERATSVEAAQADGINRFRRFLHELDPALGPREQALLEMRFYEDLTQAEIAGRLGVSQPAVFKALRQALGRLRRKVRRARR